MKYLQLLFFMLCCELVCACSEARRVDNKISFPVDGFKELKGEDFLPDVFWGKPVGIWMVEDRLVVTDKYEGKLLTVVDLEANNHVSRVGNVGNAPNEFLNIRQLTYQPDSRSLGVYDGMARNYTFYKIDNDGDIVFDNRHLLHKVPFTDGRFIYDIIPLGDCFLTNGCFDGKQFALLDKSGSLLEFFGEYPGDQSGINDGMSFFLKNQTMLQPNLAQDRFVAAGTYNDWLVFYKQENGKLQKLKEYFSIDSNLSTTVSKEGSTTYYGSAVTEQTFRTYLYLTTTANYVYALYFGLEEGKMTDPHTPCYVLKFDWNGELKDGYIMDCLLLSIAVDEVNQAIYGVTFPGMENSKMVKYEM